MIHRDISVLDVLWLCQFIIGPLLAPESFPHHLTFVRNDGQVTVSEIEAVLKKMVAAQKKPIVMDVKTVVPLIEYLGLCYKVDGKEDVYLFPAHLPLDKPSEMWKEEDRMKVYVGRRVECPSETSIISPGTFNFFQCRAYVELGRIHVAATWRDGIVLCKQDALECPVECLCTITKLLGQVDFIVRGGEGSQPECLTFLQTVMLLWKETIRQHSPGTVYEFRYLSKMHIEGHKETPGAYTEEQIREARVTGPSTLVWTTNNKDYNIGESLKDLLIDIPTVCLKSEVLNAILKHGATRWYALSKALGYSEDEVQRITHDKVEHTDKVLALFSQKAEQIGQQRAEEMFLDACSTIEPPIISLVRAELKAGH